MNPIAHHKLLPLPWFIALTAAVVAVILFVGLKPRDFSTANQATLLSPSGIRFEKIGIAFTDPLSPQARQSLSEQGEFSMELILKPENFFSDGFNFILFLYDGKDRTQLVVAQWRSAFIVMNGDDYSHRRKTKRIFVNTDPKTPLPRMMTITTGPSGTRIYLDGDLAAVKRDLILTIPRKDRLRLFLGNSAAGKHPWEGEIYGLSIFGSCLSEAAVAHHFQTWTQTGRPDGTDAPVIAYGFNGEREKEMPDLSGGGAPLHIPARIRILYPKFFLTHWNSADLSKNLTQDAVLNFFGFIPLGITLAALFIRLGRRMEAHSLTLSLFSGFLISAAIESLQAWIPTRSSDLQDLILNTLGTLVGAMLLSLLLPRELPEGPLITRLLKRF